MKLNDKKYKYNNQLLVESSFFVVMVYFRSQNGYWITLYSQWSAVAPMHEAGSTNGTYQTHPCSRFTRTLNAATATATDTTATTTTTIVSPTDILN